MLSNESPEKGERGAAGCQLGRGALSARQSAQEAALLGAVKTIGRTFQSRNAIAHRQGHRCSFFGCLFVATLLLARHWGVFVNLWSPSKGVPADG